MRDGIDLACRVSDAPDPARCLGPEVHLQERERILCLPPYEGDRGSQRRRKFCRLVVDYGELLPLPRLSAFTWTLHLTDETRHALRQAVPEWPSSIMDDTLRFAPGRVGTDSPGCYTPNTHPMEVFRALGILVHFGNRDAGSRRGPAADLPGTTKGDGSPGRLFRGRTGPGFGPGERWRRGRCS